MASSLMIMNTAINSTPNQLSTENMKKTSNSSANNHMSEKLSITTDSINKNAESSSQCLIKSIPVQNHSALNGNFNVSRLASASSLGNHSIMKNNQTNSASSSSSLSTVTSATTIQPITNTTPLATPITQMLKANSNSANGKSNNSSVNVNQYSGSIVTIISKNLDNTNANNKSKSAINVTNNLVSNNSTKIAINESASLNRNPTDNSHRFLNRLSDETSAKYNTNNNNNNNFNSQKNNSHQNRDVFISTHELKIATISTNASNTNHNSLNGNQADETEISSATNLLNSRDSTTKIKVKYNNPASSALEMDDANINNNINECTIGANSNGSSSPSTTSSPSESSNTSPVGSLSASPIAEHLNNVHLIQTDFVQLKTELDNQYKNLIRTDEPLKLDHNHFSAHETKLALDLNTSDYVSASDYSYIKSSTISRAPSSSTYMKAPIPSSQSSHNKTKKRVSFNDCLVQVHLIPNVANMLNEKYKQAIDCYQIDQLTDSADSTQSDEVDFKSSTEAALRLNALNKNEATENGVQNALASTTYNNDHSNKYLNQQNSSQQANHKKTIRATSAFITHSHQPSVKLSISNLTLGSDQQVVQSELSDTNNERPPKSYTFRKEMNASRNFHLNEAGETTYTKLATNEKVANAESSLPFTIKPSKRITSAAPASHLKQVQEANNVKLNSSSSFNSNDINPQLKFLSNLKKLRPSASLFNRSSGKSDFQVNGCKEVQTSHKHPESNENNSSNLIAGTPFSFSNFSKSSFKSSSPTKYVFLKPDDHALNSFSRSHTITNLSNQNNSQLKAMNNFIINNSMSNNSHMNQIAFDPVNNAKTGSEGNGHKSNKISSFNSINQMVASNDANSHASNLGKVHLPVSRMNRSSARLHSKPSLGQVTAIKIRPNMNAESEFAARTHSALPMLRNSLNQQSMHGSELTRSDLRALNGANGLSSFSFKLHPTNSNLGRSKTFVYPNAGIASKLDNRRVNESTVDKTSL